jgi:hypothetical protein
MSVIKNGNFILRLGTVETAAQQGKLLVAEELHQGNGVFGGAR